MSCGQDQSGADSADPTTTTVAAVAGTILEEPSTTAPASTVTTGAPSTSMPTTTTSASATTTVPTGDVGTFADPVIASPQTFDDNTFCAIIPTRGDGLRDTGFGEAARPATPISSTLPGEPACILSGKNVGEISFAVTSSEELSGDVSPQGTWSLTEGNTSYLYCSEEDAGDPACAYFIALDEDNALTVFVFLPTNDLEQLGEVTRRVGSLALDNLPDA